MRFDNWSADQFAFGQLVRGGGGGVGRTSAAGGGGVARTSAAGGGVVWTSAAGGVGSGVEEEGSIIAKGSSSVCIL